MIMYLSFRDILYTEYIQFSVNTHRLEFCIPQDFLWDFLNHQEGPRIRDRLSHGEINLETFPREVANQIVGFAITILCRFSDEEMFSLKVGTNILFSEDFFFPVILYEMDFR